VSRNGRSRPYERGHRTEARITERTAYFHFSNIISKLGVLNRHEAIAKAITLGIIQVKA